MNITSMPDEIVSNPYDFGSPIQDEDRFADRTEEREKIKEYLKLSDTEDPSYYHLALTGSRASGKTSLVNLTKEFADEMGFLTVKMPLNEDLVQNDVDFFSEMIDSIMTAGTSKGMYGGRGSKTYQKFRDVLDSVDFEARYELPLGFGSAYVGAQKRDSQDKITQKVLKEDLVELHNEASDAGLGTIVVLLDECDLLSQNKALLQKLRNIFTDIDGYILVLSGTEDMFPDLSDTFSPLPRSFVSIPVDDFEDIDDTGECIKKPLSDVESDLIDTETIHNIHRITGGSPYEINLVCHHMYRRYSHNDREAIELSKSVLDDVLDELEGLRQEGHHEIADKIGDLSTSQLDLLTSTLEFPNSPPQCLKRYALLDHIDELGRRDPSQIEEEISNTLADLVEMEVVEKNDNTVRFAGSQFDSLYLRYFVASSEEPGREVSFFQGSEKWFVSNIFSKVIQELFDDSVQVWGYGHQPVRFEFEDENKNPSEYERFVNFGISTPLEGNYALLHRFLDLDLSLPRPLGTGENSMSFRCDIEWLSGGFTVVVTGDKDNDKMELENMKNKIETIDYKINFNSDYTKVIDGQEAEADNNYEEAIKSYEEALEINPQNKIAKLYKAESKHAIGDSEVALDLLREICDSEPDWIYPFIAKGLIKLELGEDRGYEEIKNALPDPVDVSVNVWRLIIAGLDDIGESSKANRLCDMAVQSDFDNEAEKSYFGRVLSDMGRPQDGLEVYEKIDETSLSESRLATLHYNIACAHSKENNKDQAINYLNSVADLSQEQVKDASEDDDFDNIRDSDEFQEIVSS